MFKWLKRQLPKFESVGYEELFGPASNSNIISAYPDDHTGGKIQDEVAMRVATVYRCVALLAGTISSMPLLLMDHSSDGENAERIQDHPVLDLLHRPNEWQTGAEFRKWMTVQMLLKGNAYAYLQGTEIWPLDVGDVEVKLDEKRRLIYKIQQSGGTLEVGPDKMLHLKGLSLDGLEGLSVLQSARLSIIHAQNADNFGAMLYKNKNTPGGVLSLKEGATLSADRAKRLTEQLDQAKREKAHGTMILEDGMKWQQVSLSPEDSQFIETRSFQREEIATFFGIPPHLLGNVEKQTSFGRGIEQQSIGFVTYTLNDYFCTWEEMLANRLLPNEPHLHFKHNTASLLRGDVQTRFQAYLQARQMGVLSANEIRAMEGWGPRLDGGGDEYQELPAGGADNLPRENQQQENQNEANNSS